MIVLHGHVLELANSFRKDFLNVGGITYYLLMLLLTCISRMAFRANQSEYENVLRDTPKKVASFCR